MQQISLFVGQPRQKAVCEQSSIKRLLTGTQKLDCCWKCFKKIVASNLRIRNDEDGRVNDQLRQMVLSFMFRHNDVADLSTAFAKLCKT